MLQNRLLLPLVLIAIMGISQLTAQGLQTLPRSNDEDNTVIVIEDGGGSGLQATVKNVGGESAMVTTATIESINVPNGKDPRPDLYFKITNAGAIGDIINFTAAATANDTSTPDDDLAAVDFDYTLVAEDVGNEVQLIENFVDAFNIDAGVQAAFLEADAITGADDRRRIVHVSSTESSLDGEFHERATPGDIGVSATGTTTVSIDTANEVLISRAKETRLERDIDNPHLSGIIGISGSVRVSAESVGELLEEFSMNGGSNDLAINCASDTVFTVSANAAGGQDKVIEIFKLYGSDGNIKVGGSNFLGLNAPLTNGLLIEITNDGVTNEFRNLKTTTDFLARMASSPEKANYTPSSGVHYINATFDLVSRNIQLVLDNGSTDKIEVTCRDDLSSIAELFFVVEGFLRD